VTVCSETPTALLPGVSVVRLEITTLYSGMMETYSSARIEQGRSEWRRAGKTFISVPGMLHLKQPGDVHRDLSRDGLGVFQMIVFDPRLIEVAAHVPPQLDVHDPRGATFHRLHDAVSSSAQGLALEVAVAEAIAGFSAVGDTPLDLTRPVRRAVEMLRAMLAQSISLDDLAAHANLDKFHLCRAFRSQIGMPPHTYLTHLRIMRAKQLLSEGVRPSDVAPRVGFYDQRALNRHFRRIVGVTPGQFAR
jgi:AraC-like DNA-binding protein